MRMSVHNPDRQHLFTVDVDLTQHARRVRPPGDQGPAVPLNWDDALSPTGHLQRCPVCACRQLYVRKDFPHGLGLAMVIAAATVAVVMFATGRVWWGLLILGAVALVDAVLALFTKRCLVCYRCRSEFRNVPIGPQHEPWDLATGEKYRPVRNPGGLA